MSTTGLSRGSEVIFEMRDRGEFGRVEEIICDPNGHIVSIRLIRQERPSTGDITVPPDKILKVIRSVPQAHAAV